MTHPPRTRATNLSAEELDALDPGIRRTVALLREAGFDMCDSGDGRSKAEWIASGEAMAYPNVTMRVEPDAMVSEARRLRRALRAIGVEVPATAPEEGAPSIQASYDPGNDIAVICLYGIGDTALP